MRRIAVMMLALSVAACSDNDVTLPTNTIGSIAGTWTLRTIGGVGLPFVLDQAGADKIELMSASIMATSVGTFTTASTERTTIGGVSSSQSFADAGNYDVNANIVTFTFSSDGAQARGVIRGDSLTFGNGGPPVVYRRQ